MLCPCKFAAVATITGKINVVNRKPPFFGGFLITSLLSLSHNGPRWESNPQPPIYKTGALPIELGWLKTKIFVKWQRRESNP